MSQRSVQEFKGESRKSSHELPSHLQCQIDKLISAEEQESFAHLPSMLESTKAESSG